MANGAFDRLIARKIILNTSPRATIARPLAHLATWFAKSPLRMPAHPVPFFTNKGPAVRRGPFHVRRTPMSTSRPTSSGNYVVVDLEFLFDREAHARYMEGERDEADAKVGWSFKRVVAAAAMALTTTGEAGERQLEVVRFDTFGRPEHDERAIVAALFAFLQERPDAVLVTWGGEFMDLPVLRTAALEHGLRLPVQLQSGAPYLQQPRRRHLDLCISSRGGAKPVHLVEYAIRLGVPAKLAMKAVDVGRAAEQGKWSELKAQAESDVVTTALILGRHLYATCELDGSILGADTAIARRVVGSHAHRAFTEDLRLWLEGRTSAALRQAFADYDRLAA